MSPANDLVGIAKAAKKLRRADCALSVQQDRIDSHSKAMHDSFVILHVAENEILEHLCQTYHMQKS